MWSCMKTAGAYSMDSDITDAAGDEQPEGDDRAKVIAEDDPPDQPDEAYELADILKGPSAPVKAPQRSGRWKST